MLRYSSVKFDNLICLEKNIPVLITIGSLLATLDTQIYMVDFRHLAKTTRYDLSLVARHKIKIITCIQF